MAPLLDERQRRLMAGALANILGRGGPTVVARASGMSRNTVIDGARQVDEGAGPSDRIRQEGGGRPKLIDVDPNLLIDLDDLVPLKIQFTPNASGAASGKAGFTSNATGSPTVEQLTGTGVAQSSSHYVSLSWNAGAGKPVGYDMFRSTVSGGPYAMINPALEASTNYTDNTVVSGTTYS